MAKPGKTILRSTESDESPSPEANWKVRELAGETLVIEIVVDMRGNLVSEGESHADGV